MIKVILFILFITFSSNVFSQVMFGEVNDKKVLNFHENYFTFSKPVKLYIRGEWGHSNSSPVTVNAKKIYNSQDTNLEKRLAFAKGFDLSGFVHENLRTYFEKLPDGKYMLPIVDMVVDEKGELVYFDFGKLKWTPLSGEGNSFDGVLASNNEKDTLLALQTALQDLINQMGLDKPLQNTVPSPIISEETEKAIYLKLYHTFKGCPKFKPAVKNGKAVPSLLWPPKYGFAYYIIVKNHKMSLLRWNR